MSRTVTGFLSGGYCVEVCQCQYFEWKFPGVIRRLKYMSDWRAVGCKMPASTGTENYSRLTYFVTPGWTGWTHINSSYYSTAANPISPWNTGYSQIGTTRYRISISTGDSTAAELRLALTITLTLTDTGFAVLTLLQGYRMRFHVPNARTQEALSWPYC